MTKPNLDLWPEGLDSLDGTPPAAILRQQAGLLAEKTGNLVIATVQASGAAEDRIEYDFYLRAPALGRYRYRLFFIRHGVSFYPAEIHAGVFETPFQATSEGEFVEALRAVLSSDETKGVIGALLAQVKMLAQPDDPSRPA